MNFRYGAGIFDWSTGLVSKITHARYIWSACTGFCEMGGGRHGKNLALAASFARSTIGK